MRQHRAGVGRRARRAAGAGRRRRRHVAHGLPHRLDDEELHGRHRARPARRRASCASTTRSRSLAGAAGRRPTRRRSRTATCCRWASGLADGRPVGRPPHGHDRGRARRPRRRRPRRSPSRPAPGSSTPTSATCCSATSPADTTALLLEPLGLDRTTWTEPVARRLGAPPDGEPIGHGAFAPMGGLWSCVEDLATWVAWLDDAFPPRDDADDGPLRRSSRREMQQVHRWRGRRRRLRLRARGPPRRPLRDDRRPLRRAARVRLEHALAARAAGRRGRPRQLDVRADGRARPEDARRPRRPRAGAAVAGRGRRRPLQRPPRASSRCSRRGTTPPPTGCSPTTWPSTSRTSERAAAAAELVAEHGSLHVERVVATSATRGRRSTVAGDRGSFSLEVLLTPLGDGCIEQYERPSVGSSRMIVLVIVLAVVAVVAIVLVARRPLAARRPARRCRGGDRSTPTQAAADGPPRRPGRAPPRRRDEAAARARRRGAGDDGRATAAEAEARAEARPGRRRRVPPPRPRRAPPRPRRATASTRGAVDARAGPQRADVAPERGPRSRGQLRCSTAPTTRCSRRCRSSSTRRARTSGRSSSWTPTCRPTSRRPGRCSILRAAQELLARAVKAAEETTLRVHADGADVVVTVVATDEHGDAGRPGAARRPAVGGPRGHRRRGARSGARSP